MRHTPLSEALHGQWSARLDPRAAIAAAGLPAPLPSLIYTVVRRSRLWRRERRDVARELLTHFADGLAAGRSPEDLARAFGSPKQAARLIRRAKLRSRPLVWQCWRAFTRLFLVAFAVSLVGYAALSARFYLGHPVVAHNYWHEINAARHVAEGDRAWPLYREALFKLGQHDANWIDTEKIAEGQEGKDWNEAVALLARHRNAIELVREGAKKPRLGYYMGDPADLVAARAANVDWLISKHMPLADQNTELISGFMEGPQNCRSIARLLEVDARVAAMKGDGATAAADITALISLSEQLFEPHAMLVEELIGLAIFGVAMDTAGRILADTPAVLDDVQLRALAHRIAAYRGGTMSVDFSGERMLFDDILQRAYTDDGRGNGRFTPAGLAMADTLADLNDSFLRACNPDTADDRRAVIAAVLVSPGLASLIGGRKENRAVYRSIMDEMIALHQGVPWKWDRQAIDANHKRLGISTKSIVSRPRHFLVDLLLPGISAVFSATERTIQERDAAEVAIALEIWHRRHGEWPASLDALVPDLLPAVPADRLDGQPLRYVVRDSRPVVYSIGNDRNDDGGRPPTKPLEAMPHGYGPLSPETLKRYQSSDYDGDWILWPPLPEELPAPEDSAVPE
jgi:hypothetical protein